MLDLQKYQKDSLMQEQIFKKVSDLKSLQTTIFWKNEMESGRENMLDSEKPIRTLKKKSGHRKVMRS